MGRCVGVEDVFSRHGPCAFAFRSFPKVDAMAQKKVAKKKAAPKNAVRKKSFS